MKQGAPFRIARLLLRLQGSNFGIVFLSYFFGCLFLAFAHRQVHVTRRQVLQKSSMCSSWKECASPDGAVRAQRVKGVRCKRVPLYKRVGPLYFPLQAPP